MAKQKVMRWALLLTVLVASKASPGTENLDKWLHHATLTLPPIQLKAKVLRDDLDLDLQRFSCTGLSITSIQATHVYRRAKGARLAPLSGVSLSVSGISITNCATPYNFTLGQIKLAKGSFSFGVRDTVCVCVSCASNRCILHTVAIGMPCARACMRARL